MRAALILALALFGCPPPQQQSHTPEPPPTAGGSPPPPHTDPPPPAGQLAADGESCTSGDDCESGLCEGEGCGADQPGSCVSRQRACTRDLRTYCGCDGQTFQGSGSCPNRRYAGRGECDSGSAGNKAADGEPCGSGDDCESGQCEGQGCGDNDGVCVSRNRPCTADLSPYCGCDDQTFHSSGTCANRLFKHRGECKKK